MRTAAEVPCTVTVVVDEAVWPLSSTTLQVTVRVPGLAEAVLRVAVELTPVMEPLDAEKLYVKGRFCGLVPWAVTVADSLGWTIDGFAEQLIVGG